MRKQVGYAWVFFLKSIGLSCKSKMPGGFRRAFFTANLFITYFMAVKMRSLGDFYQLAAQTTGRKC